MGEIVKQCILSSESYISNESKCADKENVLLCPNSCLPSSLAMMNQWVKQSLPEENKYNKDEFIIYYDNV